MIEIPLPLENVSPKLFYLLTGRRASLRWRITYWSRRIAHYARKRPFERWRKISPALQKHPQPPEKN